MMLEVADLHAYYGKSHILQGVDMHIDAGEVVSLLGRNGVGRSTTVKAIMGEVPPQGSIKFKVSDIAGLPSYRIAHLGLGYVPAASSAVETELSIDVRGRDRRARVVKRPIYKREESR